MGSKFTLKAAFISLMMLAIFLGAWQLATQPKESTVAIGGDAEYAALMGKGQQKTGFPTPAMVGKSFVDYLSDPFYDKGPNDKGIGIQLAYSLGRVAIGFLLATAIALPVGFTIGMSPLLFLRRAGGLHQAEPEQLRRAVPRHSEGRGDGPRPEEPPGDGRGALAQIGRAHV